MSANRWAACPQCTKEFEIKRQKEIKRLSESYGKVPEDVYLKNIKELEELEAIDPDENDDMQTMREDGDGCWIDSDGNFRIIFRASCTKCNFTFEYEHEQKLL